MRAADDAPYERLLEDARERFEEAEDFTVSVEEEFALLDRETLDLVNRFEEVHAAAQGTPLEPNLAGELIASEIEVKTGKQPSFADVPAALAERRAELAALVEPLGLVLGATGTHPWSSWRDQRIIDTPHYRRNDEILRYVVWRNNTFGIHTHVAIRGADRAVRVTTALRNWLPELLAVSSSSPFHEGVDTGLHSARTQVFTRFFPRCGVPDAFGSWDAYAEYVRFLYETGSVDEACRKARERHENRDDDCHPPGADAQRSSRKARGQQQHESGVDRNRCSGMTGRIARVGREVLEPVHVRTVARHSQRGDAVRRRLNDQRERCEAGDLPLA